MRTVPAGRSGIVTLPDPKGPEDKLLYRMDWTAFLLPLGDQISASSWQADGLTAADPTLDGPNHHANIWISGGKPGTTYTVRNHISTTLGRDITRSFKIEVQDR